MRQLRAQQLRALQAGCGAREGRGEIRKRSD
jgi:hypothetical protein